MGPSPEPTRSPPSKKPCQGDRRSNIPPRHKRCLIASNLEYIRMTLLCLKVARWISIGAIISALMAISPVAHAQYSSYVGVDKYGVAHVLGSTMPDAAYGSGRQQMKDVPVTVMFNLAAASGQLAEFIGEGTPVESTDVGYGDTLMLGPWLRTDLRTRQWRITQLAAAFEPLPSDVGAALDGFVAGLEAGRQELASLSPTELETRLKVDPPERNFPAWALAALVARPMTRIDVLRHGVAFAMSVQTTALNGLVPGTNWMLDWGSNAWIVPPSARAGSANPLLLSDPHHSFDDVALFRPVFQSVHVADGPAFAGWGVPGLFGAVSGFNNSVAWGYTSNLPTTVRMWNCAKVGPDVYLRAGAPNGLERETTTLRARHPNGSGGSSIVNVHPSSNVYLTWSSECVNYPVLAESPTHIWLAGATMVTGSMSMFEYFYRLSTANSMSAFDNVVSHNMLSPVNIMALGSNGSCATGTVGEFQW